MRYIGHKQRLGLGAPFGSGEQYQSWIHVYDLVHLYYYAVISGWEGVYNAVAPQPVTNEELTITIANQVHKPLFMPNIPQFLMKLMLGEMHMLLFTSQNVSASKAIEAGYDFKFKTIDAALKDLL